VSPGRRLLRWSVLGILALLWNGVLGPLLHLGSAGPDPVLTILVAGSLLEGPLGGTLAGFVLGLLADLSLPATLGLHALVGTVTGYLAGRFAVRLVIGLPLVEWSMGATAALGYGLLVLVGRSLLAGGAFWRPLVTAVLPSAVLTGVLLILVLRLLEWWGLARHES